MSFSYNPYKHIEIVEDGSGLWAAYCHGCGAVLKKTSEKTPVGEFIGNVNSHLKTSHNRNPDDFQGWSKF